ncbi:MAG: hypothetical protein ABI778_12910, partial [Ignavibacteriota bacterium]
MESDKRTFNSILTLCERKAAAAMLVIEQDSALATAKIDLTHLVQSGIINENVGAILEVLLAEHKALNPSEDGQNSETFTSVLSQAYFSCARYLVTPITRLELTGRHVAGVCR